MPVKFPPGRLRLATSPTSTGSVPIRKTTGIAVVACLAAIAEGVLSKHDDDRYLLLNELSSECRKTIVPSLSPTIFDSDVLALCVTSFTQALPECAQTVPPCRRRFTPEQSNDRHFRWLLRPRCQRNQSGRPKCRYELAPSHGSPQARSAATLNVEPYQRERETSNKPSANAIRCPLWVTSRSGGPKAVLPLFLRKQTSMQARAREHGAVTGTGT